MVPTLPGSWTPARNDEKSSGGLRGREEFIEGNFARLDQRGDALRMLGVGDAFKEAVGRVKEWGTRFSSRPRYGREARVMATAGFGKEYSFDAATGRERFFRRGGRLRRRRRRTRWADRREGATRNSLSQRFFAAGNDGRFEARGDFAGGRHV